MHNLALRGCRGFQVAELAGPLNKEAQNGRLRYVNSSFNRFARDLTLGWMEVLPKEKSIFSVLLKNSDLVCRSFHSERFSLQ